MCGCGARRHSIQNNVTNASSLVYGTGKVRRPHEMQMPCETRDSLASLYQSSNGPL